MSHILIDDGVLSLPSFSDVYTWQLSSDSLFYVGTHHGVALFQLSDDCLAILIGGLPFVYDKFRIRSVSNAELVEVNKFIGSL